MTSRSGKRADGTSEYDLGNGCTACRMEGGVWYIYEICEDEDGNRDMLNGCFADTGIEFFALRDCRKWAKENPDYLKETK